MSISLKELIEWLPGTTIRSGTNDKKIIRATTDDNTITAYYFDGTFFVFSLSDINQLIYKEKSFSNVRRVLPDLSYKLTVGNTITHTSNSIVYNGTITKILPLPDGNTEIVLEDGQSFVIPKKFTTFPKSNTPSLSKYLKYKHKYLMLKQLLK